MWCHTQCGIMYIDLDERLESVTVATVTKVPSGDKGGDILQFTYTPNESEVSVWPSGVPPDGSPVKELKHPLLILIITCYVLSGVVMLWAVVCIMFNFYFRKKK